MHKSGPHAPWRRSEIQPASGPQTYRAAHPESFDLAHVARALRSAASIRDVPPLVGFFYPGTRREFAASFRENADTLAALLDELGLWLREHLSREDVVAVLGM